MQQTGRGRLIGGFLLLTLIWGTTWAAIRIGLQGVPPFTGVALRFAIAGALLLALSPLFDVRLGRGRHERALWVANGLLSFCLSYSIVYWSEQHIPSGLAAVLFATYPLLVAPLAHFLLAGERLTGLAVAGLLLGFAGVAVIFSDDLSSLGGPQVRHAALVMLGAPLVSAVATVAIKRWGRDVHPLSLSAVPMLIAGVVMGAVALLAERHRPVVFDARSVGALLYLAILGSAVTFTIYYWLLARVTATRVALMSYLIPIVAVAVGAALFAEPLRPRLLAGSALVLAGVAVVGRWRTARPRPLPRVVRALAVGPLLAASGELNASPQVRPVQPPVAYGERVSIGAGVERYDALYGSPEFRALDDESARPWPERRAIRTIGRLEEIPGKRRGGEASPGGLGGGGEWDNSYAFYQICREEHCLALTPVQEMLDVFAGPAAAWVRRDVEVIGAIDKLGVPGQDPRARPMAFLVWSVFEAPNRPTRRGEPGGSGLEPLVRYPKGAEGRVVTVSGVFRGANLFEDLPPESRRRPTDWVLQDGPFSIWITGKAPKGKGWSLDPRSRSDCAWRLLVEGAVETEGGYIYLRAKSLSLIAREKSEPAGP